jgi:V8-like Glu-specific endopeptidase
VDRGDRERTETVSSVSRTASTVARAIGLLLPCAAVVLCAVVVSPVLDEGRGELLSAAGEHVPQDATRAQPLALTGDGPAQLPAVLLPAGYRVGALSRASTPEQHYCTASVIDSPHHDLLITAAHCIHGGAGGTFDSDVDFSPGSGGGRGPAGLWRVRAAVVDPGWSSASDPAVDVALLVLAPRQGRAIEEVVGGNPLATGRTPAQGGMVGIPGAAAVPHACSGTARVDPAEGQYHVFCRGFSAGTSGSPWLSGPHALAGSGSVIGVIGGFQRGGPSDDDSYSSPFGEKVAALYARAVALG